MLAFWKSMKPYFATKKQHPTRKQQEKQQYFLLTYRSGIKKIFTTTYYQSDAGWGCMLRVGQMFVANLYYKIEKKPLMETIELFYDNKTVPFSLPTITDTASKIYPEKKPYEWFSPCECGFILKDLLDEYDEKYRISICNDNCIFLNEIEQDRENLIVMAICRIGLDQPQPEYLNCVVTLMQNQYFNSIMGGTPKRAHLFLKYAEGYLGFLDPHSTQKVPPFQKLHQKSNEYIAKLQWIKQQYIDCSMALVFVVPRKQVKQFWGSLQQTKQQLGESFFIYLAEQRPIYDHNQISIIQIDDNFDFSQLKEDKQFQHQNNGTTDNLQTKN